MDTLYLKYADTYYPRDLIEEIIARLKFFRSWQLVFPFRFGEGSLVD